MSYDSSMLFVASHEWVKLVEGKQVLIGITEHAQDLLGDLVYIELPKIGVTLAKDQVIGVVESVKAASDLYSPVSGRVVEINQEALDNPSLLNTDPHNAGWLVKVELTDMDQLDKLLNLNAYSALIG